MLMLYADVDILRTHPAARRRGVATMLVQWGLEKAKEDEVEVYLSSTEMGRPVYEKLGFEVRKTGETAGGHVQHSMVWAP
jgi:GNAT superfamily N-acetyltransferase